jgi:Ornithine/acetylornithine aminotransferase
MNQAEQKSTVSEAVRKHKEFLFPAVATYYQEPIALVKGEGEYVWDDQGNKYLDAFGGVLTVSVGHANPKINAAIIEQTNKIQHTSALYANPNQSDLAEKLAEISPGKLKKSFFTSTGTEADDTAQMAAKLATGRHEIVVLRHSYSGRRRRRCLRLDTQVGVRCPLRLRVLFTQWLRIVTAARLMRRRTIAVWRAQMISRT